MNTAEMKHPRPLRSREQQEYLLREALDACAAGNAADMLRLLYASGLLDGLKRRLEYKWDSLPNTAIEEILGQSVDQLYEKVRRGDKIFALAPLLTKITMRRAIDYYQRHPHELVTSPESLDQMPDDEPEENGPATELIAQVRQFIPRLGAANIRNVMTYLLDAYEAGRWDITSDEVAQALGLKPATVRKLKSRGMQRLTTRAAEAGMIADAHKVQRVFRKLEDEDSDREDE